jgi:polysaccharide deacetylase family protein (PEP-CTERM system associated)
MTNALTIDVEDWYHDAEGLGEPGPDEPEVRVEANLRRLLDCLDAAGARSTLFVLGEVAERSPALVREAHRRGHEIASHGYSHKPLRALLRREFREQLRRSLRLLSDLTGERVRGYRAPYFSIKAGVRWPAEILAEEGVIYDSSVLPIDRPPGLELVTPQTPYRLPGGVWEIPISVSRYLFWHLPLLGGFALRALPYGFTRRRLEDFNREFGPAVVHLHPWEIDVDGPEPPSVPVAVRALKKWGRGSLLGKLERLLADDRFGSIREAFPVLTGNGARDVKEGPSR